MTKMGILGLLVIASRECYQRRANVAIPDHCLIPGNREGILSVLSHFNVHPCNDAMLAV